MRRACAVALFFLLYLVCASQGYPNEVYSVKIQGAINPASAGFIVESLAKAEKGKAEAFLILLDTPGGLDTSMREIVKSIMESAIPVIVYVYPSGARAASAGSVILLASHVAAMAPGTNAGAAHPVSIGRGQEKPDKTMMEKVTKDAEAYVRSIAKQRGRNEEWAAKSVKESASITASDAVEQRVADLVATSPDELLANLDGREVAIKKGKVVLKTRGKKITEIVMPPKYRFLSYISDPNVAYILMMMGIYGILFEIYSPGAIFPGVVGGISLILALYAFQTIPISFAGLFLILLGILFFILEIKIVSHGVLGIAGIISLVIGSIMLIDLPSSVLSISYATIIVVAAVSGIFFFGVISYAIKAQLSRVKTGGEGLIGEEGVARTDIGESGKVFVHGEIWNGRSDEPIREGEKIVVTGVQGLIVEVKRKGG
ncbi:NfeD family protein [Syntrophorhabdus aromaticivorans]|uniref:NfeD family protein n=1 Tax=Syntrophorhabdus aromaticivorans TaxID=328301 RepID=UPI0004194AFA|nr:nodulation protein NfeD [Syntrophorhabdus aromaticivorans]